MKKIIKDQKAFTLLELLVVIAIIGVLVTVLLPNFMGFRTRGGDAKKKSELKQMKSALQMFYNDFGYYPATGTDNKLCCEGSSSICAAVCGSSFTVGDETYMKDLPEDYEYQQNTVDGFFLYVTLDNSADQDLEASALKCGQTAGSSIYYLCED